MCARAAGGGSVLVANANKDLMDFSPSPHSYVYHGVCELRELFSEAGFTTSFWGNVPVSSVSFRQRILRPVKRAVVALDLMPRSMRGKRFLKRLIFGKMTAFPAELTLEMIPQPMPINALVSTRSDALHKVILCEARKSD
jgi:hypothetical protein